MKLNLPDGNMYEFIDYTGNPIKEKCSHDCSYCYMKKWDKINDDRLDEEDLTKDIPENRFIFVGSSTDMFAKDIPESWIRRVLDYCDCFNNLYLFQTKNPQRILEFIEHPVFTKSVVCTTIETNRHYPGIMRNAPKIEDRVTAMEKIANTTITPYQTDLFDTQELIPRNIDTYVTIEPIMKFDLTEMVECIKRCQPKQVNIGANSRWREIRLPEPSEVEIQGLIFEFEKFTTVELKDNLKRLMR